MRVAGLFALVTFGACSSSVHTPKTTDFAALSDRVLDDLMKAEPSHAVSLGLHAFDGQLPDRSPAAISATIATMQSDRDALEAIAPTTLTPLQREERGTLLQALRGRLFDLIDLDVLHTNPMSYSEAIDLDAYVIRDYAPVHDRAAAVVRLCRALPAYLAQARANVKTPMPRTWIDTALLQTKGLADFADKDVRKELAGAPELQTDVTAALDTCKRALVEHAAWLTAQQATATQAFALGKDRFLAMLAETQGISSDVATLMRLAEADLARNTKAIEEAAHALDPHRSVAEVVATAADDRPTADTVLGEATRQATEMRQFLIDHHIVTIPGTETAEVKASPAFQRWNSAFLDGPGPFETKQLPSYFYISPPDPTWTPAVQRAYIIPRADLLITTIHEVYPGHFIHGVRIRRNPSRVLRSFGSYATSEGWAHYAEEMMFDAGAGGDSPQAHIGQLKEALLRNVRFVVALGEHTGGMTVDQAEELFRTRAFVDPGNARQQAVRGTFDPMFLSYTLGKLVIRKLRDDWMAKHPGATLGEFHDAFLSHGSAPLPVIRRAMVDDDALL
jgi:uncharacterized protein (DUF885 family)